MREFLDKTSQAKGVSLDKPGGAEVTVFSMFRDIFPEGSWMRLQMDYSIQRAQLAMNHHLSDGGLIDNFGVMAVWGTHEHGCILVSNGGATLNPGWRESLLWRVMRYVTVMNEHGRRALHRLVRQSFEKHLREGVYWDIHGKIHHGRTDEHFEELAYSQSFAAEIARIRTDLDAFSEAEQKILENHGYTMVEMAKTGLRVELVDTDAPLPVWPHPEYADESIARSSIPDQSLWCRIKSR
jgi:NTE family protein